MSLRLSAHVYDGTSLDPGRQGPFGLYMGQLRHPVKGWLRKSEPVFRMARWYSRSDELGWGDLDVTDLQNIASGLEDGEVFIILPTEVIPYPGNNRIRLPVRSPDRMDPDQIVSEALAALTHDCLHLVGPDDPPCLDRISVPMRSVSRALLRTILSHAASLRPASGA